MTVSPMTMVATTIESVLMRLFTKLMTLISPGARSSMYDSITPAVASIET